MTTTGCNVRSLRVQTKRGIRIVIVIFSLWLAASLTAKAQTTFQKNGNLLVMSNGNVRLEYNLAAGTTDFFWQNSKKLSAFYSGVTLNTGYVKGISYSSWTYSLTNASEAIITATGSGLPTMIQHFYLDHPDSFLIRMQVSGANLAANWMGPVVVDATGGVSLGVTNDNRALYVPFDNDAFVRYNAMPINNSATSYEVGAFYDNTTRNGLVVGSVTHDTWKSGVYFNGANNALNQMNVFGGATSPYDTDSHGSISGNVLSSPIMFVGFGADWRTTLENFADENLQFAARLPWTNGVPFGWNSWGVIQANINYSKAVAVSDYIHANLQNNNFNNQGQVYVNLDSYWDNLSSNELKNFAAHCHANGQKAGIYWAPFVWWGSASDAATSYVEGTGNVFRYSDTLLKTSTSNYQNVDGALAMDPSHPATQERINYFIGEFTNYGFDYIKLDFLSHGALEGVHYNPAITTGMQAYNLGMQYVLNQINGHMFISESIAPLFPYQYAHSRRIACDAEGSFIGDTEYTMNSVSYGWWLDHLYQFNDPDIMVFGNGEDTNENQSRLISGAVTGVFLDGDDLTTASGQTAGKACLTNAAINTIANLGKTFTPIEGNTGSSAADIFARQDGTTWCLAFFNYSDSATNKTVSFSRAGITGTHAAIDLWNGSPSISTSALTVSLNPRQAKLIRLLTIPALTSPQAGTNGSFYFSLNGDAGHVYTIQESSDFIHWSYAAIVTNTTGTLQFSQTNTGGAGQFYRSTILR